MTAPDPAMADNLTALVERRHATIFRAEMDAGQLGIDVMDADAIDRYRDMWRGKDGHDMAPVNLNSLRRLIALIDHLADALEASQPKEDAVGGGEDVMIGEFIARWEEAADGVGMDADTAQALARKFKRMQGSSAQALFALIDADLSISTGTTCRIYQLMKQLPATPAVGGIPAGMVAVPVEPTEAMKQACLRYARVEIDVPDMIWSAMLAAAPAYTPKARPTASDGEAREREAWPGRNADLMRRRVVTLATLGLMLSKTKDSLAYEIEGFEPESLYAEVLMALAVEDADDTDIALEIARDHPEGDTLADAILAALPPTDGLGGERGAIVSWLRHQSDLGANRGIAADKGTTKRAAFGGGSLALKRAADAIEAGEHRTNANNDATPPTTDASERMREALEVGERFLDKCFSAWSCGEPTHRVKDMLDHADKFRASLNALALSAQQGEG